MKNALYLLNDDSVCLMESVMYEKEADLQDIIARNPDVLKRDTDPEDLRFYLIQQELAEPSSDGEHTIYLDHLFVDSDGMPVLVEVKRSSDNRIHREVMGQMLDYAAHIASVDLDKARTTLRSSMADEGDEWTEDQIDALLRKMVENIRADHMKLVFVADRIPPDLEQIILFFDRNVPYMECYGVELEKYVYGDTILLSKTVYSNAVAIPGKQTQNGPTIAWNQKTLAEKAEDVAGPDVRSVVEAILNFFESNKVVIRWGTGKKYARFFPIVNSLPLFQLETEVNKVAITFDPHDMIRCLPKWGDKEKICEKLEKVGAKLSPSEKYYILDVAVLKNKEAFSKFKQMLDELLAAGD